MIAGLVVALCICCDDNPQGPESPAKWIREASPAVNDLYDVVWNGSEFRAVGISGIMISSANGRNWSLDSVNPSSDRSFYALAWSEALSLYAVATASNVIYTSSDGDSWTPRSTPYPDHASFDDIVWYDTMFVARGDGDAVSTNGRDWFNPAPPRAASGPSQSLALFGPGIGASDTLLVTVGYHYIASSGDAIHWTLRYENDTALFHCAAYWAAREMWVAAGHLGVVATSPDAITWTRVDPGYGISTFFDICPVGDTCYIVGSANGPGQILWSTDGTAWVSTVMDSVSWLTSMAYSNDRLVIVGYEGEVLSRRRD